MSSARKKGSSSRGGTSARSGTSSARSGGGASARSGSGGTSRSRGSGDRHGGSSSGGGGGGGGGASNKSQPGLMEIVQHRFKKDVFESAMSASPGWKILVVDEISMKVISAAVGMYDIMEQKVTLVEALEKKRAPFPDMGVIYILAPTEDSINRLLSDYASKTSVLYGPNVFLYFLGKIPLQYLDQLKKCKQLIKRLKALSEINVDFLVKEQRAYTLDLKNSPFSSYYLRRSGNSNEDQLASKLVTMCATLNEYPYIRYKRTSGICSSLATIFKMKMDEFVGSNPTWWYHGSGKSGSKIAERDRSTILLLDRSSDCLTPLLHDFTYQAMVHDLLKMEGDKITYQNESPDDPNIKEDKDVLLNEKDQLWVEMRGKHIAKVIEVLSARINEVVNSSTNSAIAKKSGSDNMSISQLASALKELPEYREVMSKLSQHMHLAHECMDSFTRGGLMDVSDIEQTLATGKDEDGRSVKLQELIGRLEGALVRTGDVKERLRLILIATVSQNGLSSADRDRLLRAAQLSRDELMVLESLSKLGIQTLNNSGGSAAVGFFGGMKSRKGSSNDSFDEDSEYASSRYMPMLKPTLQELVTNQLSIDEYPSVIPMPAMATSSATSARRKGPEGSARKKKGGATGKWSKTGVSETGKAVATNFTGGRNLVFMVGGLAYSELRIAREVMEKESKEIIVGSTEFVSPQDFIDELHTLAG